jgi:hypothetical protein
MSIVVHQWNAKQFWVDHQSFKQEDNIYCLEKVQIIKLNVYLQFKLNYDVCYTYCYIYEVSLDTQQYLSNNNLNKQQCYAGNNRQASP